MTFDYRTIKGDTDKVIARTFHRKRQIADWVVEDCYSFVLNTKGILVMKNLENAFVYFTENILNVARIKNTILHYILYHNFRYYGRHEFSFTLFKIIFDKLISRRIRKKKRKVFVKKEKIIEKELKKDIYKKKFIRKKKVGFISYVFIRNEPYMRARDKKTGRFVKIPKKFKIKKKKSFYKKRENYRKKIRKTEKYKKAEKRFPSGKKIPEKLRKRLYKERKKRKK